METKNFLPILLMVPVFLALVNTNPKGAVGGAYAKTVRELPLAENLPETPVFGPIGDFDLDFSAKAVLVKDRSSSAVLFRKNHIDPLPIASLTKLMTALVAEKLVGLEDIVRVLGQDVDVAPYRAGLLPGEEFRAGDLVAAMLIASANDAAMALARHAGTTTANFVREMNRTAWNLNMRNTSFSGPVGFDDPQAHSNASDLAILVEEFLQHPRLVGMVAQKEAVIAELSGKHRHALKTTNRLLAESDEVRGLKTGYTAEARGNLIILLDDYYLIVLGSDNREEDAKKIMRWVKENYSWR